MNAVKPHPLVNCTQFSMATLAVEITAETDCDTPINISSILFIIYHILVKLVTITGLTRLLIVHNLFISSCCCSDPYCTSN